MVPAQALAGVCTPGASLFLPISGGVLPSEQVRFKGLRGARWAFPLPGAKFGRRRITRPGDERIMCVASAGSEVQSSSSAQQGRPRESFFGSEQTLPVHQRFMKDWPAPTRYVACTVIVAGALAAGYAGGRAVKGTPAASLGGAIAVGAVGGLTAFALNSSAPNVAAVQLHNALVNHADPKSLTKEEVDSSFQKFGVSRSNDRIIAELRDLYDRFITNMIPPGNEDLRGDEADEIIKFKYALGLEDPDAASVHIEIGRRISRQRMETGDREQAVEERRTFQKLVYVSQLVFGEASKFLLPWKRVFKVTDAQVDVAIRDNAQRFFQTKLIDFGESTDLDKVRELRRVQLKSKLPDEVAAELVRNNSRKHLEVYISQALEVVKSRAQIKDTRKIVKLLDDVIAYNVALITVATQAQADSPSSLPGLGPASILGGQYEGDRQMDELKQLYRTYMQESFAAGVMDPRMGEGLGHLKNIFGFGNREADTILLEVTIKVYRRRLAQAVNGGDLDAAPSKAAYLQMLCEELKFDPRKAGELHEEIYRQKLEQCLADGSLSEADIAALLRLRVLLCIPKDTVDAAHASICGRIFTKVVDEAIGAGVDGYDADMKTSVQNAVTGLRLTQEAAMEIASKADAVPFSKYYRFLGRVTTQIRAVFVTYVKRSRSAGNRVESARELKKMIIFSNLVVSELIADIKGDSPKPVETPKEQPKPEVELDDELEMLQTLKKTKPAAELEARMAGKSQSDITLMDDFELKERTDFYRTYLLYCLSGETTGMPMGTQIVTQRDSSEFVRLGQLGTILGLSSKEVAEVHKGLAEQAFRQQAQVILADGQLNKVRVEQLTELQQQLGLPSEAAQKVIKSITSTRMAGAIESAVNQGRLTVEEVKELKAAGVDVDSMISRDMREKLFKKIVDSTFSAGTGDFSEEDIYDRIPTELGLDTERTKEMVQTLAKERLTNSLIQAISLLRQKKQSGVVESLNNLLACDKAVPSQPLSWAVRDELLDLFCLYTKTTSSEEKSRRLQELLGIDDDTAQKLKEEVTSGGFSSFGVEEEEFAF